MEDIIIILEWIKRLAKDLRNESLRKEIERIKKMNQMNEQLFINKELFLRFNKMLAVIRLSTNSQVTQSAVRNYFNCSNDSSAYQSHLRRSNYLIISESNSHKHSKIINHVVLNIWNWKLRGFPFCLHIPSRQPQKGFWVFSFWFCRKESWLFFQLVSQILSSLALLRRLFRLWIRLGLHSSGWGNFFSRD